MTPSHGSISILFPPFSARVLCSPTQFGTWPWWGPVYGWLVFTETT